MICSALCSQIINTLINTYIQFWCNYHRDIIYSEKLIGNKQSMLSFSTTCRLVIHWNSIFLLVYSKENFLTLVSYLDNNQYGNAMSSFCRYELLTG